MKKKRKHRMDEEEEEESNGIRDNMNGQEESEPNEFQIFESD